MGAQTVNKNSLNSILNKIDNFYICEGNKYLLNKDYNIEEQPNMELFSLIEKIDDMLSSGFCSKDMEDIIQKINLILITQ